MAGVVLAVAWVLSAEAQVPAGAEPGTWVQAEAGCGANGSSRSFGVPACPHFAALVLLPARGVTPARPAARDLGAFPAFRPREEEGSRGRLGAVLGAVAGGVATYVLLHQGGSTSLCDRSANQDAMDRRECWGLTVIGAAAGAGLGAWLGSRFR